MSTSGFEPFAGKRKFRNRTKISQNGGLIAGLFLVALGVLLLLHNFNVIRFRDLFDFWPILPIAWGAQAILRGKSTFTYLIGGLAILLGSLKLLNNLDVIQISSKFYAPIILITLGVAFLARNFIEGNEPQGDATSLPSIHPVAIFGGVKRRVESQEFEGGEMLAMFGGVELDFRRCRIKGDKAVIEANAVFGGIHMRVPDSWTVEFQGVAMFGGFEDKTLTPRVDEVAAGSMGGGQLPQKLVITGNAIFGGVSVEN